MRKLLRAVALSVAAAATTALAAAAVSYLLFPVTAVVVEGARMFPEQAAWQAVPDRSSLLTLNTERLEREIESHPWVKGAEVNEDWESGIVAVEVEERRAVLLAEVEGRTRYLAADGTELPESGGARLKRLRLDEGRLGEILAVTRVLDENGVALESVRGAGAGGVEAVVSGRRVLLGREVGAGQARALAGLADRHPAAPYFDLRSPERVVVGASSAESSADRSVGADGREG